MRRKKEIPHILWFVLPAIVGLIHFFRNSYNNYSIYKGVFYHLIHQTNLYGFYPNEYFDTNHYGPFFGLIIAPFAIFPDYIGLTLWTTFHAFILYKAFTTLPLKDGSIWIVLLICIVDLNTSSHNVQVNPGIAGLIILSWYFVNKEKDFWAVLFVMLGTFVKLYGIVGLVFWFFSKHKLKYIYSVLFWSVVLFILPMAVSSPQFVTQSYFDWYDSLVAKNLSNQTGSHGIGSMQDVSLMGLVRRVGGLTVSNLTFIGPGLLLQLVPLLRTKLYGNLIFQLRYLASILMFAVIFSSSSESSTYIIAVSGVAIWFITQDYPISRPVWALLIIVLVFTSLSATDIFPYHIRQQFIIYSIKAFPCCLVWVECIYQLLTDKHYPVEKKWIFQG